MKPIYTLFILLAALLCACEDPIQVKLDEGDKLLVVDAFITDQKKPQTVRLTLSDSYFSGQNPPAVSGAQVSLTDQTSGVTFTFTETGNGNYVYTPGADTLARIGHQYMLNVRYDGEDYQAYTRLNRTTTIDSIGVKYEEQGPFVEEGYYCTLWAFDVPGPTPDHYWIKSFRNNVLFGKGSQINIAVDAANGVGADGLLFTPPIALGITPFGEKFNAGDSIRVEIHSISKETFYFLRQVFTQTTNSGLFATTPENVRTNIHTPENAKMKAVGWFNMAAVSSLSRKIP
jgi:hypothetical protein